MSIIDDLFGRPTDGERDLRERLRDAKGHAEELEEKLVIVDPREATDPTVHSRVCWERQVAAQAWRKANALQSELNGAENRRYSRSLTMWMAVGFAANLLKGTVPLEAFGKVIAFLAGLG